MSLELHYHPLASFCWKALIALYENETPFEKHIVDLGDEASRNAFYALWPMGKMPVLKLGTEVIPESTIVVEWLREHRPGKVDLIPAARALAVRLADRFYDGYVQTPMQKIVADRLRPKDARDATGVAEARATLATAYAHLDRELAGKTWAVGDTFTMADCAACPALYWADRVAPIGATNVKAYLERLRAHPSCARVLEESEPYQQFFPRE